ncbi:MAG: hypothetical protein COA44_12820 [Arcobacter sp.]|nr:MAG: hypothetical protein COA44_12820 [Arcobacter sp.]
MSKVSNRLESIFNSINDIEFILDAHDIKITAAIEDKIIKPAIRMHIIKIAEQFSKLKDDNEFSTLEHFESHDLKGLSSVRNFIAHDYDSVDDLIIEDVVRLNLPKIKNIVESLLK